jgi:transaldolase
MLTSGELKSFMDEDGVSGVTSNSLVFERAVTGSHDYDDDLRTLALHGKTAEDIYWILKIHDAQQACDLLRPIYDQTNGKDGLVSLDILPRPVHGRSQISIATGRRGFLEENLTGSPKAEARTGAVIE